ncbi:Cytochrome P450 [Elaphomyces granulatus]
MAQITPLAASVLILSYLCYRIFWTYWKLRYVPGPFWARITNLQRILWVKSGKSHEIYQNIHEKYGDFVRIGPNTVSVSDPAAISTMYPMRPGFPKSKFYRAFMPYTKNGLLPAIFTTQDEKQHKQLKSPIAALYSLTNVVTFEEFVNDVLDILFQEFDKRYAGSQTSFDLGDWLQYFAFDVMGTMTFSSRYGFLETGTDVGGMLQAIWNFMLGVAPMTQIPWVDKLWNKNHIVSMFKPQTSSPILKVVADRTSERQQKAAFDTTKETKELNKKDFLSRFLEIRETNSSVPPWAITAWTFSNVIAGSDSTAVVMRTVFYNLLAHPDSLSRLYKELTEKQNGLSRPYPGWSEVSDLPYLDACINEAIRLHPPFCLPLERVVPEGGVTICGQFFEAGTIVGMNPYVVNRHQPTFGDDVDSWRPERWLNHSEEHRRKLEQSVMTFGAGRRVCLGKYVALLEIKKIVPALFLNYEIELLDPKSYKVENCYFFKQKGINVRIKRRDQKTSILAQESKNI